jgi:hypothetical protein
MVRLRNAVTLLVWITPILATSAPGQEAPSPGKPSGSVTSDTTREQSALEEMRAQASEDLDVWEARVLARRSWVREATLRVDVARKYRDAMAPRIKQGLESKNNLDQANLELAEMEARRDQKALELKEAETKAARVRRRLAMLNNVDKYAIMEGPQTGLLAPNQAQLEERIADLESELERVRAELDEARERVKAILTLDRQKKNKPVPVGATPP